MNIALFYHSLVSDWNHGNAHFLRGVVADLQERGHGVRVFEPQGGWSRSNLVRDQGEQALHAFHDRFPGLDSELYDVETLALDRALEGVDLVLVHEWSDPELVRSVGAYRRRTPSLRLLFHDTHHRLATAPDQMEQYDLRDFDGVLAYGEALRTLYLEKDLVERVYTWHEAADTRIFHPRRHRGPMSDLVWIGNWGDEERTAELEEFLIDPVRRLGLTADVHGVRYPEEAQQALSDAGVAYHGWLPNHQVPDVFARARMTVHVPRRPYVEALPGIPTIRIFEALACGIPLVCARFHDVEELFEPGEDFLVVQNGAEMRRALQTLKEDSALASRIAVSGRQRILARHTCSHRVDELLAIAEELGVAAAREEVSRRGGGRKKSARAKEEAA